MQGGISWLGWAATLPAYRRKGAQLALFAHRVNEAIRMGCALVSAETRGETVEQANPSYHNLLRLGGFQLAYLHLHYRFDPVPSWKAADDNDERRQCADKNY